MIALILNVLSGGLLKAWQAKLTADSDEKRLIADAAIADIKARSEAREQAAQIRRETAGYWEMRVATAVIAWPTAAHYALVTYDTMDTGRNLAIPALPSPMDEWQAAIILSFFGVQLGTKAVQSLASALRRR